MKRIIALALVFIMLFGLAACGNSNAPAESPQNDESPEAVPENTEKLEEESGSIEVDKKLFNVEVSIPASFFGEESEEEIIAGAMEQGIKECTVDADGTVNYIMSKDKHAEILEEFYADAEKNFADFVEGETAVASFVDIQYNDTLSEINVTVNDQYTVWDMFNGYAFYIIGAYYQIFGGADPDTVDVVVNFVNEAGELKDSMSYREFMDNSAEESEDTVETAE